MSLHGGEAAPSASAGVDSLSAGGPPAGASESAAVQLAVSTVIFALRPSTEDPDRSALWLPLVRRLREPFQGMFALPGGPLPAHRSLEEAAAATLDRATGLVPAYLEQLYAFGRVHRSQEQPASPSTMGAEAASSPLSGMPLSGTPLSGTPQEIDGVPTPTERVVSVVYWASIPAPLAEQVRVHENIRWVQADQVPRLAFDHNDIVEYALTRLRNKVEYSRIAHSFLGEEFTITQLRAVYEAILGRELDPANFRRQIASSDFIEDTGRRVEGTRHRPPRLFRYKAPHRG